MCGETYILSIFLTDETVLLVDNSSVDLGIISILSGMRESAADPFSDRIETPLGASLFAVYGHRVEVFAYA